MKNKVAIIIIVLGFGLILHANYFSDVQNKIDSNINTETKSELNTLNTAPKEKNQTTVQRNLASNGTLKIGSDTYNLYFDSEEILYDVLIRMKEKGDIKLSGIEFDGLGFFVQSIGDLVPPKGKSLVLYINNKKASYGVSSTKLNNNDLIEFKIEDNY